MDFVKYILQKTVPEKYKQNLLFVMISLLLRETNYLCGY